MNEKKTLEYMAGKPAGWYELSTKTSKHVLLWDGTQFTISGSTVVGVACSEIRQLIYKD